MPVRMNPFDEAKSEPNYWLSCMLIDEAAMCRQVRSDCEVLYSRERHKSCPSEILEVLNRYNAEGRPIWKPMHMQPIYRTNRFVCREEKEIDVGRDIFHRGLCLPSDNKMTIEQQKQVIEIIKKCFE